MPDFLESFNWLPLVVVFLLFVGSGRVLLARAMRAAVFRVAHEEPVAWEALPLYLRERVTALHPTLKEAGFVPIGGLRETEGGRLTPQWTWPWLHPDTGTVVHLRLQETDWATLGQEHWVIGTRFTDGTGLLTVNSAANPEDKTAGTGWVLEGQPGAGLSELWERHVARVQAHAVATSARPVALTPETALASFAEQNRSIWEMLRADTARLKESPAGTLRLRWGWILRQVFAGPPRAFVAPAGAAPRVAPAGPSRPFPYSEEARDELDLAAFRHMEAGRQARRLSPRGRTLVALGSLAVFAAFLWGRGEWRFAAILAGVLLFHEAGHWLAMRWFGSRDTSMLFIPFFGGAAIQNDRPNVKPWQQVVILLAGPLPGLVIGFALGAWTLLHPAAPWMNQLALVFIALNAFNLLVPVLPLDGGQLVGLALFGRTPHLAVAFKAVSAVALIVGSTLLGLGPLLWIVGAAFLVRIPLEWRTAAIHRDLRREADALQLPDTGEEDWLRRIFRRLRGPKFEGPRAPLRYQEALRLVTLVRHPGARWGTALFALAGWLAPLWLPVAAILPMRWQGQWRLAQAEEQARAVGLPRPADVRRERDERARALPPEQNAGVVLAQMQPLIRERDLLKARRSERMDTGNAVLPDPDRQRLRALDEQLGAQLDEAGRRPAYAMPPKADLPSFLASLPPIGFGRDLLGGIRMAEPALSTLSAALDADDYASAARRLETIARLSSLFAASAEPSPSRNAGSLLDGALLQLEPGLARLTPSPSAATGLENLATVLPEAAWVRRTLLPVAPRDRAWEEAGAFEWSAASPRAGVDLPWSLRVITWLGEMSPFVPARRAQFVADSREIQSSLSDPARPWGWEPPAQVETIATTSQRIGTSANAWRHQREGYARLAARLGLARAALAWHHARMTTGRGLERLEDLRAPFLVALSRHPLTDEPMRLERGRNGRLQLSFPSPQNLAWQLEGNVLPSEEGEDDDE